MALLLSESFEGGTSGTNVATTNTTLGFVNSNGAASTNSTTQFDSTQKHQGSLSAKVISSATGPGYATLGLRFTDGSSGYSRVYVYFAALPSNAIPILQVKDNAFANQQADVVLTAAGAFRMRNASLTQIAVSGTFTTGQWIRVELGVTGGAAAQTAQLRVYSGANLESNTTTTYDSGALATGGTGNVGDIAFGIVDTSANTVWFDDFAIDDATWLGTSVVNITLSGPVATTAATALAGTVTTSSSLAGWGGGFTGGLGQITSVTLTGPTTDTAVAAAAGTVTTTVGITLAGPVCNISASGPAGAVSGASVAAAAVANTATTAPAGSLSVSVTTAGVGSSVATAAPSGSVSTTSTATVSGPLARVSTSAPTGAVTGTIVTAGPVATATVTAAAGSVAGSANTVGPVATCAAAAAAGGVAAGGSVTAVGPRATATVTAPTGSVSTNFTTTVTGPLATFSASAPVGSVSAGCTITGSVADSDALAPNGSVLAGVAGAVLGIPAQANTDAPAGTIHGDARLLGVLASVLISAPAGTLSADAILTADPGRSLVTAAAGDVLLGIDAGTGADAATVTVTAFSGAVSSWRISDPPIRQAAEVPTSYADGDRDD